MTEPVKAIWQMMQAAWEQTPQAERALKDVKRRILEDAQYDLAVELANHPMQEAVDAWRERLERTKRGEYDEYQLMRIEAELRYGERWQAVREAVLLGKPVPQEVLDEIAQWDAIPEDEVESIP